LLVFALFSVAGGEWSSRAGVAMGVVYMYMPALATVILQKLVHREPITGPLGVSLNVNRFWLVAWFLPLVLALSAFALALLLPEVRFSSDMAGLMSRFEGTMPPEKVAEVREKLATMPVHPFALSIVQALLAGATINSVVAFGEELGWRGFLHRELSHLGFWRSAAVIGFVWGLWHAPLVLRGHNYPDHPGLGVPMMVAFCVLLAPLLGFVRNRGKSVLAATVMHGSLNATVGLAVMLLAGGNDLLIGLTGAVGFVVLLVANAGVWAYEGRAAEG
jgi:membrane protease YdiL (CAAX protease family)